jgi:tagatose 1,6-diphosphate aldolase
MTPPLTIGKIRGLQQLADPAGIMAMCAMDHRGTLQRLIDPTAPERVTDQMLTTYKLDLTELLAPESTAVLLDPLYGAAQSIAAGVLPGNVGLLVSLEESGYEQAAQGRTTTLLPDWSVEKIKRMGASAVKILLYYRPDLAENAASQQVVTQRVAEACRQADLPFLVEPIAYSVDAAERDPALFAQRKTDLVVESARQLTALGFDVLKAEFPADLRYEQDDRRLRAACERLDAASAVPWILLSAGVNFEDFARQVKIACQAGASGFLGGRAIWEEATHLPDRHERRRWLAEVGAARMRRLRAIAAEYGRPWWKKWGEQLPELVEVTSEWYRRY